MKIEFIDQTHTFFDEVKSLGDKNSSTLGFMPEGAFLEHANKKCIIIAYEDNQLAGYLMFRRVPRSYRLAIVHLCVKDEFRGKNISVLLLDTLRDKYKNSTYNGIILNCRSDYEYASKLWKRYGFICKNTKRSKSIEENYLNIWWYEFNNTDLFTFSNTNSYRIKALLDANIIIKLRDDKEIYEPAQDPRSLLADWLTEEVDYFYAPETYNEIVRDKNKQRVQQTRSFLNNFLQAKIDIQECQKIAELLKKILTGNTENDNSDRIQLATAIVSETSYFITLDHKILEKRSSIENHFNIQIFTPQELILEIDRLLNKEDYSPAKLSGVVFHSIAKITNSELNLYIDTFLNKSNSENKRSFENIVYGEVSNIENARVKTVKTLSNEPIAFFLDIILMKEY
ncbi:MAG: GNAT family N-acetyltransferase [Bacteroides sp.]|nr:GNAT family N-acetyltransferase [Bacteroides sp.]